MILYSPTITARLRYTCEFIGKELGHSIVLTDDKSLFCEGLSPCINYSPHRLEGEDIWMMPHPLLFEKGIRQQEVQCFEVNGIKKFFPTGGDISFDIFASVFYLLSRYEEWLPHKKDMYGRFAFENSLAYKEKFLDQPLINEWLQEFGEQVRLEKPLIPTPSFSFVPTYDIDEAFSFQHKDWKRNAGAIVKDFLKRNWKRIKLRRDVLQNKASDPFDSFDWIDSINRQYNLQPRYFFLVAAKTGRYDRNILPTEKKLQSLIRSHAAKYSVGIHPSWQTNDIPLLVHKEIKTLSSIAQTPIVASRQHFIRFTLPQTYRQLIAAGIREDYSMGYGSINGFRASVASPFYWYDLEKEQQTSLLLYPFCYMEANSFFEQKSSPLQALEDMRHYYKVIKAVNGIMISIWHNTFLGTDPLFAGWREVYEQFVKELTEGNNVK